MLKATELQLYDWVKLKNHKGEWIDNSQIDVNLMSLALKELDVDDPFFVFEDIPLTEEMLKMNGFICEYGDKYWTFPNDSTLLVLIEEHKNPIEGDYDNIVIFHVSCVRRLQHILRDCGLTDLANNFRLK